MKAAYIDTFASDGNVQVGQFPMPTTEDKEICVAVAYAGVNPVDSKIAEGRLQNRLPHQLPLILGWEAAGSVYAVGKKVTTFKPGDRVYFCCRKPMVQWGCWAEFVTCPAEWVAHAPKNLSLEEAAAIPLAALTAWQALFDKAHLKPKETILIHAGGGGVGSFAIQWAKLHGVHVIATGSAAKFDYIKSLGADVVIDYKTHSFAKEVKRLYPGGIDVVFDTIGGTVYKQSFEVLKKGGRIVSLLEHPDEELASISHIHAHYLFVSPNAKQLEEITHLFETGKAKVPPLQVMPLDQAGRAVDEIKKGHTLGKIVLKIHTP